MGPIGLNTAKLAADETPGHGARVWLVFVLFIMAAWLAFLIYEVAATANPVIVSRPQVLAADLVLQGEYRANPSRVVVDRAWWGPKEYLGKEIEVSHWTLPGLVEGMKVIVALQKLDARRYRVQPIPSGSGAAPGATPPSFYPVNRAVEKQLVHILSARVQPPEASSP